MPSSALSNCRSCGASIRWIKTHAGKNMPLNAAAQTFWLERDGDWFTEKGQTSHFATCPNADAHRKPR